MLKVLYALRCCVLFGFFHIALSGCSRPIYSFDDYEKPMLLEAGSLIVINDCKNHDFGWSSKDLINMLIEKSFIANNSNSNPISIVVDKCEIIESPLIRILNKFQYVISIALRIETSDGRSRANTQIQRSIELFNDYCFKDKIKAFFVETCNASIKNLKTLYKK